MARLRHQKFTKATYKLLAYNLTQILCVLNQSFNNHMKYALTGGKDTSFVTALLIHAGFPVQYYTFGEKSGTDAKIAKQIADAFNLNYRAVSKSS